MGPYRLLESAHDWLNRHVCRSIKATLLMRTSTSSKRTNKEWHMTLQSKILHRMQSSEETCLSFVHYSSHLIRRPCLTGHSEAKYVSDVFSIPFRSLTFCSFSLTMLMPPNEYKSWSIWFKKTSCWTRRTQQSWND